MIETVLRGQELTAIAEMPLADRLRGIALVPQRLGERDFVGGETAWAVGPEHVDDTHPERLAPCEYGCTGWAADRVCDVVLTETCALPSEAIDDGSLDTVAAIDANVTVSEVVCPDPDDVGPRLSHSDTERCQTGQQHYQ